MGYAYSNNKDKDIKRPNQITALGHSKPECGFIARVSSRSIMNVTGSFKQTRCQVTQPKICSAKPLGDHIYNNSLKPIKKKLSSLGHCSWQPK